MDIYPAVDILGGTCVQLVQGVRDERTKTYGDPLKWAVHWLDEGATALHIINLDGAFGSSEANRDIIRTILSETGATVQLGGGIRSVEDAGLWLDLGVSRVILGTLAVQSPEALTSVATEYGSERVVAGVDAKGDEVVVRGWTEPAGSYLDWARRFEAAGAGHLLYTNVDVEGLEQGINFRPVARLTAETNLPVIAAGGVSSGADVAALKDAGVAGVVLGSALYSGKIDFKAILEIA